MGCSGFETQETASFVSGSALALLHLVLHDPNINAPVKLLQNRLALRAASHCLKLEGRAQTEADIRDAYLLTSQGDAMGPAGDMLVLFRKGFAVSLRHAGWRDRLLVLLPLDMQEPVLNFIDEVDDSSGNPVAKAALLLSKIIRV